MSEEKGKCSVDLNRNLCCICQKRKYTVEKLSDLTGNGIMQLRLCAIRRKDLHDDCFSLAIERLLNLLRDDDSDPGRLSYHRECYATFTSSTQLDRLRKRNEKHPQKQRDENMPPSNLMTRTHVVKFDKNKCIICQQDTKEHLRKVMTDNMNTSIVDLATVDAKLNLRIKGLHQNIKGEADLIAADALYHSCCILREKKALKTVQTEGQKCLAFIEVCKELRVSASLGQVLQLSDVWDRYECLAKELGVTVPTSFTSRRATFKEKLESVVGDVFHFFQPLNRAVHDRKMILIPTKLSRQIYADKFAGDSEELTFPSYDSADSNFRTVVHAALIIRKSLLDSPAHTGLKVSKEDAVAVVPDSLHLFLSVLVGGQESLDLEESNADECEGSDAATDSDGDDGDETVDDLGEIVTTLPGSRATMSVAQDIVYMVSKGKKLTPKHIGLALTLHQRTRSRKLVDLFNRAGHCMSYHQLLQADTALAKLTLQKVDQKSGAVIPPNFKPDSPSILHVTADNIDILSDTLDGKNTLHVAQMVAFQRSANSAGDMLKNVKLEVSSSFKIPHVLNDLCIPPSTASRPEPLFREPVDLEHYTALGLESLQQDTRAVLEPRLQDIAFCISRAESSERIGWTQFHKERSLKSYDISSVGYMPLILNPAHEISTLCTVIQRSLALADHLGKRHVVLTTDQNLYCKLVELRWNSEDFMDRVVLRMGGLHIQMNFLRVIGKHMAGSGIVELWRDSGLLGEGVAMKVLDGKSYAKGMRAHKLTFQALWRILTPQLISFMSDENAEAAAEFKSIAHDPQEVMSFFQNEENQRYLSDFISSRLEESENFALWWSYIDMVSTLLMFTRGLRDGEWSVYRRSLPEMLPYVAYYDHTNYVRSLSVYISDMQQLDPEVEGAFERGDFAVLRSNQKFCQVDPDHAQEWIVGVCKDAGGIVGITQDVKSLQRWALSFHWRSEVTQQTFEMYGFSQVVTCNEASPGRRKRDNNDEDALLRTMSSFELLGQDCGVCNIVNKDQASEEIQDSLLCAKKRGQEKVFEFVRQRFILQEGASKPAISFYAPIQKTKALTLTDLYKKKNTKEKENILQADRNVLNRLLVAFEAGRKIDLRFILTHELLPVPLSLAEMNGVLRSSEKSALSRAILSGIGCPETISVPKSSSLLIIDGQALIIALGKPANAQTFGDFAIHFSKRIKYLGAPYTRVDIVFDRYRKLSVKSSTRVKRARGKAPIRRKIENASVPLPSDWCGFMSHPENKADLSNFLCTEILKHDFGGLEVVVSGGFEDEMLVRSTNPETPLEQLAASHEEGDTRAILHAVHSNFQVKVIMARDTDICLLAAHHFPKMKCAEVWMMSGTAKERKFVPIHSLWQSLTPTQRKNILAFHAVTGCDSTSKLATISKKAAWNSFLQNSSLLSGLGTNPLKNSTIQKVERFVVQFYKVTPEITTGDAARHALFGTVKPEALPPTSDALKLHILRSHYQTCVWENAHLPEPSVPDPIESGWESIDGHLLPRLMTKEPVPKACKEILSCGCKSSGCVNRMCGCRKSGLTCTKLCACKGRCLNKP